MGASLERIAEIAAEAVKAHPWPETLDELDEKTRRLLEWHAKQQGRSAADMLAEARATSFQRIEGAEEARKIAQEARANR